MLLAQLAVVEKKKNKDNTLKDSFVILVSYLFYYCELFYGCCCCICIFVYVRYCYYNLKQCVTTKQYISEKYRHRPFFWYKNYVNCLNIDWDMNTNVQLILSHKITTPFFSAAPLLYFITHNGKQTQKENKINMHIYILTHFSSFVNFKTYTLKLHLTEIFHISFYS